MKKVRKSLAIIFALAMLFTNGTVQYAFAENSNGNSNSENNGTSTVAVESTDPYVYVHNDPYLYQYRSSHRYGYNGYDGYAPAIYRLINTTISTDTENDENDKAASLGYCCDLATDVKAGTKYKRLNIEDADYYKEYQTEKVTTDPAKHIRLVLKYGFWQDVNAEASNVSMKTLAENVIAYEGTKKEETKEENPAALTITPAEALAATQYAVWHFSNYNIPITLYTKTDASNDDNMETIRDSDSVNPAEHATDTTSSNIERIYKYLINLDPDGSDELRKASSPASPVCDFVENDSPVIAVQNNDGSYNVDVNFKLTGTPGEDGNLTVTAKSVMKSSEVRIANIPEKTLLLNSQTKAQNGYYTITFDNLTKDQVNAIQTINLTLDGTQDVGEDVYFYESEKDSKGNYVGQCFVGLGSGLTAVHQACALSVDGAAKDKDIEIVKYDKDSVVQAKDEAEAEALKASGMIAVEEDGFVKYAFPVKGARFQLYAKVNGNSIGVPVGEPKETNENGIAKWTMLVDDGTTYYCEEVEVPDGYKKYTLPDGTVTNDISSAEARTYIPNCHDTGSVVISKTVEAREAAGSIDTTQHFKFKVEVDFAEATLAKSCKLSEINKNIDNYLVAWSDTKEACGETSHPTKINWEKDANAADKWTANITLAHGESLTINDLPVGTECTVTELDADGKTIEKEDAFIYGNSVYVTTNATKTISVASDITGKTENNNADANKNVINLVNNKCISVAITKTDIAGTDEVAGAILKITEKTDGTSEEEKVIDEWTSTEESHVVKGKLEKGKTYVITEVTAPEGYAYITTDIEFTIDNDGKIQIIGENKNAELSKDTAGNTTGILVKDDAISFTVNKTDLDGNELAGSEITIFEYNNETGKEGKEVVKWQSELKATYDFGSKLTAGQTYLLRETNAPDGYGYIDDVIFTVAKDGSIEFIKNSLPTMKSEVDDGVQVMDLDNEVSNITNNNSNDNIYLVKDGQTEIIVKKLDQHKNPVVGAKLAILNENGEPVLTNDGTAIEWTTDGKDKDITGLLIAGKTYILTELEAPEGYQKAEDIEFTVPEPNGESKTVTMTDVKFGMGGVDKDGNGNNNGSNNDNSISTGDRTNMGLCLILMTTAMAAGLGALTFRRKA